MRKPLIALSLAVAALTAGCTSGPERLDGVATPATASTAPSPSPPVVSSTPSAPPPSVPPSSSAPPRTSPATTTRPPAPTTLGPDGFGPLKLGMTYAEAEDTGLIRPHDGPTAERCEQYTQFRASGRGNIHWSGSRGVEVISAYPGVRTPGGIRIGSSLDAVLTAYPDWTNSIEGDKTSDGNGVAKVPGNSSALFHISIQDGEVSYLALGIEDQACYD